MRPGMYVYYDEDDGIEYSVVHSDRGWFLFLNGQGMIPLTAENAEAMVQAWRDKSEEN